MAKYNEFEVTVGAGDTKVLSFGSIRSVRVLEANIPFKMAIDADDSGPAFKGMQFIADEGETFSNVLIDNRDGSAELTVTLGHSIGRVDDNRITGTVGIEDATQILTPADVTTTDASVTLIRASRDTRKEVIVKSLDTNSGNLRIGDSSITSSKGVQLCPGESITLATTAAVYIIREGSTNVGVSMLEVVE